MAHKKVCGVQVRAFSRYAPAHLAASSMARRRPSLLKNAKMVVLPKKEEAGIIYCARLMGLDETGAHYVYEELKRIILAASPYHWGAGSPPAGQRQSGQR
jgi:hypothetical protein